MSEPFFGERFRVERIPVDGAVLHAEIGGSGPPLLLLHGYPQTHVAWHKIAPTLAEHFTVVAPDLRGYGDSEGPHGDPTHQRYCKRVMAQDMRQLMSQLGFERFAVMAHDRGARVGYRLALDHPQAVSHFASLTVIPTDDMWQRAGMGFGLKSWHWFFFAQPFDLPERMLAGDPAFFLDWTLRNMAQRLGAVTPEAMAEYQRAFAKPSVRHAMMEDYRAAAFVDLEHDRQARAQGLRMQCPVMVLWSASPAPQVAPLETWRGWADEVQGQAIDCGHLMAEEAPREVLAAVLPFLKR